MMQSATWILLRAHSGVVLLSSLLATSGCGAGQQPAELVKPDAPTAQQALAEEPSGPSCGNVDKPVEPLVVDWKSGTRTDLEVAMRGGVVVMAYGCDGMKLLDQCSLEGSYEFAGVTPKEDVIQLSSRAELWANLPLSVGKLDGAVEGSASIDLAIALVGKRGSLRSSAARPELKGSCAGATHFVKAAHIGAFAMARGERGKARAAAELFTAKAGGESESTSRVENRDGDITQCRAAAASAAAPPAGCGATIRLMLEPISANIDTAAAAGPPTRGQETDPCPEGWVMTEGKCAARVEAGAPQLCKDRDEADCTTQCDRGSMESCLRLAWLKRDRAERDKLLERACAAGVGRACSALGEFAMPGDLKRAAELLDKSCALGEAWVCWNTGQWYINGRGFPKDEAKGALMVERGCSLGYAPACASYGGLFISGVGVKGDVPRGLGMFQKLCDNGQGYYCHQLGSMYATDRKALEDRRLPAPAAVKRDVAKGVRVWEQGCSVGSLWSCTLAGVHHLNGDGVPRDTTRARELFERACGGLSGKQLQGCEELGRMYEKGVGVPKDLAKAADLYQESCPSESCGRLATGLATGKYGFAIDEARARKIYEGVCKASSWGGGSDSRMCYEFGSLLEKSDKAAATKLYADHCSRMGTEWSGGKRVSASQVQGGKAVLAESCVRLGKLDAAALVSTMQGACADRGILCRELEARDKAAALEIYRRRCDAKKLSCADVERLTR